MLADFEKLGAFYLGREAGTEQPFLYDANHLTTHAVVIGMTGSGKTGLSIALLEEAAIDGIPAIVIDPKGDLGNLLLTSPESFGSADEAKRWSDGLAAWGQDAARVARFRASADVALYTPGSRAARPISILGSLASPPPEEREDLAERIHQTATSLLGLVGITAEPGRAREHVLLASILERAWSAGEDLDLAGLVARIQDPPFDKVGVLDVESFYPKKERFELAVAYNGVLASPGFEAWLEGPPLDVAELLWTREGKPRIAILSIAHLADAQRMFFVSLLLGQIVTWMRRQPGTPSLRALLFMDEVVGYFPPVAMPPSKPPLLTLLKQARAFGLGVVLATQNPVDLDYKGLSNAGTWLVGRLQTERDKARVLDGLEGAAQGAFDRSEVDAKLSSLGKRHFYVHDVHADRPVVIESRWTMSYLRGPLTREEMKKLAPRDEPPARAAAATAGDGGERPVLPPGVPEVFFPTTSPRPVYRPWIVGAARVRFADEKTKLDFAREVMFVAPPSDGPIALRWEDAKWAGSVAVRDLGSGPAPSARFLAPPQSALDAKSYATWSKKFVEWLTQTQGIARWRSATLEQWSEPNEDERAFRARLALQTRETRDREADEVRAKFGAKLETLEDRIRRASHAVASAQEEAAAKQREAAFAAGGGLLGAFLGGRARIATGAERAARSAERAARKQKAAEREMESYSVLVQRHRELQDQARAALAAIASALDPATQPLEHVVTKPKKTGVSVHLVALAWRADPQ